MAVEFGFDVIFDCACLDELSEKLYDLMGARKR
jgi:hypothetical protein